MEVVSPTITKGSDEGKDSMGTSFAVRQWEGGVEEAPVIISPDVV